MDSSLRMRSSAASNEQQSEAGHKQLESPAARQELDKRRDLSEMVWGAKAGCRFGGRAIVCFRCSWPVRPQKLPGAAHTAEGLGLQVWRAHYSDELLQSPPRPTEP